MDESQDRGLVPHRCTDRLLEGIPVQVAASSGKILPLGPARLAGSSSAFAGDEEPRLWKN